MDTSKSTFSRWGEGVVLDHNTSNRSAIGICRAGGDPQPLDSTHFECLSCGNLILPHREIEHARRNER